MTNFEKIRTLLHGNLDVYENFEYTLYNNTIAPGSIDANNYMGSILDKYNPSVIIEIGSYLGWSAMGMAKKLKEQRKDGVIICIDTWMGGHESFESILKNQSPIKRKNGYPTFYYNFLANMIYNKVQDVVIPFAYPSTVASHILKRVLDHNKIIVDMVYIDGSHIAQDVFMDCMNYYPILKSGGLMIGDDWQYEAVKHGVTEFSRSENAPFPKIPFGVHWIIEKP